MASVRVQRQILQTFRQGGGIVRFGYHCPKQGPTEWTFVQTLRLWFRSQPGNGGIMQDGTWMMTGFPHCGSGPDARYFWMQAHELKHFEVPHIANWAEMSPSDMRACQLVVPTAFGLLNQCQTAADNDDDYFWFNRRSWEGR